MITPLDWHLLRECPVPLHIVSTAKNPLPRRILAALDLTKDDTHIDAMNDLITEAATQLAQQCGAQVHLLQAYDLRESFLAYAAGPVAWSPEIAEQTSGRSRLRMQKIGERFGINPNNQHLIKGSAMRVIPEFAEKEEMDIVVMGTFYHHGLSTIIGSTIERALYHVRSSILAIRP